MYKIIIKLNEGGPLFTYPMMVILIIVLALFIWELVKRENISKTVSLITSIGWFVIAWGFLGHTIGLITAFDSIQAVGDISPSMMAGGLKIALLNPLIGTIIFLVARASIIVLLLIQKDKK